MYYAATRMFVKVFFCGVSFLNGLYSLARSSLK